MGMTPRIVTAAEAAQLIPDGATVAVCGCLSMLEPDTVLAGIEARFLREGRPRDLTVIHPVMVGSRKGSGINRFAHDGLMRRVIGGSFSIFADYEITAMIKGNRVEAYNLPIGTIFHWLRESGAGRPGLFTDVGVHTYVDPRVEGGRANAAAEGVLSEIVRVRDREYLFYPSLHVDVAIIRGTSADAQGNISVEHEPASLGIYTLAVAAKHCGGKVIAQVKRRVEPGSIHPRLTAVPGRLVDAIVVDPEQPQIASGEHPEFTGEIRALLRPDPVPATIASAIARRAIQEIGHGQLVNLGYGIPALIPALGFSRRLHERVAFSIEHGPVGGLPEGMEAFGAAANPDILMDSTFVFDLYDAGLLDAAVLGLAQVDREGNVNVSKFAHMAPGSGGFCNICHQTKRILFCGTFTAGGLEAEVVKARVVIRREGKVKKFVSRVEQITLSGEAARAKGQEVLFITERAVFRLAPAGLALVEVAPGIDPATHILPQMEFPVAIPPGLPVMDPAIFGAA
jgi:propionate CoA-transferase